MSLRSGLLVAGVAAVAIACSGELFEAIALQRELVATLGDSTAPDVTLAAGRRHLTVKLHGMMLGRPEAAVDSAARHIAGLVLRDYAHPESLDSVTVAFVMGQGGPIVVGRVRSFDAACLRHAAAAGQPGASCQAPLHR
jgi:hypothetical protein